MPSKQKLGLILWAASEQVLQGQALAVYRIPRIAGLSRQSHNNLGGGMRRGKHSRPNTAVNQVLLTPSPKWGGQTPMWNLGMRLCHPINRLQHTVSLIDYL